MKEAIEKAIEGGWKNRLIKLYEDSKPEELEGLFSYFREDPLFWECLGKKLGWENCYPCEHKNFLLVDSNKDGYCDYCDHISYRTGVRSKWGGGWAFYMHRFTDHLVEGKSPDSFFVNLLKS